MPRWIHRPPRGPRWATASRWRRAWSVSLGPAALAGALALVATGCPGELPPGLTSAGDATLFIDQGTWVTPDQGPWLNSDTGGAKKDGGTVAADSGVDSAPLPPDKGAPKPDIKPPPGPGVGGPCPCGGGAQCLQGVCRATCAAPAGACKVSSSCPADHGCVKTNKNIWVCMPAAAPGGACNAGVFCPNKHVCGSFNKGPFMCLPTCATAKQPCGTGGVCLQTTTGCMFCSKP